MKDKHVIELRPAALVTVAVVMHLVATLLFGWSSLGWWRPNSTENATAEGSPSLILYTTQPNSVNEAMLTLAPNSRGELTGFLQVNFGAIEDQAGFRWALVGGNGMAFSAEMETTGATSLDTGSIVDRTPKVPPAESITRNCDSGIRTTDTQSVFVGGLNSATLLGTDGVESAQVGIFLTKLHFPRLLTVRDGDSYGWDLTVGQPGERDVIRQGLLQLTPATCIDLAGVQGVQDVTRLEATALRWTVVVDGATAEDPVLMTNPASTQNDRASWEVTEITRLEARFADRARADRRQAALFTAGVLSGLASGIVVLALFRAPTPSTSPTQTRFNGRKRKR